MVGAYRERKIVEEKLITAIGEITLNFALLEEIITDCINILIGGEVATVVTTRLPFPRSLDILSALYRQKYRIGENEDSPSSLKELLTKAQEAEKLRNTIIHSIWHRGSTEESLTRIKRDVNRRKGLKINTEQIDIQGLKDVIDVIKNAVDVARKFTWEILEDYTTRQISPLDAAILDTSPEFIWQRVEGAIGYELVISREPDFAVIILSKMGSDFIKNTEYKCEIPLERNAVYYWRVRPVIATAKGYWSEVRRFTII